MATMKFAWTYGDWRDRAKYPTNKNRHARLILHIEEVSKHILGVETSEEGNKTRIDSVALGGYLASLEAQEQRLDQSLAASRAGRPRTLARFGSRYGGRR